MKIKKQLQDKIALEKRLTRNYIEFIKKERSPIFKEIFYFKNKFRDRKRAYRKYFKTIEEYKSLFKKIVILRNEIVQTGGGKNFFDAMLKQKGIPSNEFEFFLKNFEEIVKGIDDKVIFPKNLPKWYWSPFNIPNPLMFVSAPTYQLPNDIYKIMGEIIPSFEKYISRIKITAVGRDSPSLCHFKKNTKSVEIDIYLKSTSLLNARSFVHEVGHAIHFLECFKNNIDPSSLSRYEVESEAYEIEHKFQEYTLTENVRNALRWIGCGNFALALFEYEIYKNPNQNFDALLASLENRIRPQKKQKYNPFYVLKNTLIESPLDTVVSSVVQTKLLLQKQQ